MSDKTTSRGSVRVVGDSINPKSCAIRKRAVSPPLHRSYEGCAVPPPAPPSRPPRRGALHRGTAVRTRAGGWILLENSVGGVTRPSRGRPPSVPATAFLGTGSVPPPSGPARWPGSSRARRRSAARTWMAGTSPAMTEAGGSPSAVGEVFAGCTAG